MIQNRVSIHTAKLTVLSGAALVFFGPIKIIGYATVSTTIGLLSVFTAKIIDDYIRNDNTSIKEYEWVPRNTTTTAYSFLQGKFLDSQTYGQCVKKFITDVSAESISGESIIESVNQYLPKVFHLTFPEGLGLNKLVKHTEGGLVAYYALSAFLPFKEILYDNVDPVTIAVSKVHDLLDHVDILLIKPYSRVYEDIVGLYQLIYEGVTSYGSESSANKDTSTEEKSLSSEQGMCDVNIFIQEKCCIFANDTIYHEDYE